MAENLGSQPVDETPSKSASPAATSAISPAQQAAAGSSSPTLESLAARVAALESDSARLKTDSDIFRTVLATMSRRTPAALEAKIAAARERAARLRELNAAAKTPAMPPSPAPATK